jgi:L-asparaginase
MTHPQRIKFIYAGGTIGMKAGSDGSLVPPQSDAAFRSACLPLIRDWQTKHGIEVDYEYYAAKDSTNMTPDDWQAMLTRTAQAQASGYDAVTFAHGTDTMAYTATALALGFHGRNPGKSALRIPIVITGAQNPIYEFGGDGALNVQNAFRTARVAIEAGVNDVLIAFGDEVFLGCRAVKVSERAFRAFESPVEAGRVGHIDAYGVHLQLHRLRLKSSFEESALEPKFGKGMLVIDLGPGVEPALLESVLKTKAVSAIVMKSLGEGNVCSEGAYSLLPFIRIATEQYQIPILIASKFLGGAVGRAQYAPGRAALDAGAIACHDTTDCAVEVKVRWLLGNGIASTIADLRKAMATSYAGEVSPPK